MPKQKIEMEIDVPDGMEIKCQGTRNDLRPVITPTECTSQVVCNVILRRKEPVRESRWANHYLKWDGYKSREDADAVACDARTGVVRLDYEDNKLVAVTLEPVSEEPQCPAPSAK